VRFQPDGRTSSNDIHPYEKVRFGVFNPEWPSDKEGTNCDAPLGNNLRIDAKKVTPQFRIPKQELSESGHNDRENRWIREFVCQEIE
jgi:hypothetical protein